MENFVRKSRIVTFLIVVACFLSNLSQLPYFVSSGKTQLVCFPIWGVLFVVLLLKSHWRVSNSIVNMGLPVGAFFVLLLIFSFFSGNDYFSSSMVYSVAISVFMFVVGTFIAPYVDAELFQKIIVSYSISTFIVAIAVFIQYFGVGFSLNTSVYAYSSKNSFAQILFTAIVLLYCYYRPNSKMQVLLKYVIVFFELFMVIILRSRATILSLAVVVMLIVISKNMNRKLKCAILATCIFLTILLVVNDSFNSMFFNDILFAGRDIRDIDGVSSGRISILREFPKLIENNWLIGKGALYFECFPLSAIIQFGIIAGSLLIAVSLLPLIKSMPKTKNEIWNNLFLLSVGFVIDGLFEGLAPFGPGIKCYFLWLFFGIVLALNDKSHYEEVNHY